MRVLGLIPARGGSKGVPRKNIRLLCGKPLLQYTVEAALAAASLDRVILSTEDEEIAHVGRVCGAEVPFLRPAYLAKDLTPTLPVVQHALEELARQNDSYDAVCLLQPTNPLRRVGEIDCAVGLLEETGADSVISFVDVGEKHPARMKLVDSAGRVSNPSFAETHEGQRRQELPKFYLRDGSVYLTRTATLLERNSFQGEDCRALIIPEERACNIDTPFDFFLAEQLIMRQVRDR